MTTRTLICALCLMLLPQLLWASGPRQRYLLAIGANSGGPDRVALKYAVSDAQRFADILVRMGGVEPFNSSVLQEPGPDVLETAFSDLAAKVGSAPAGDRTEVIVYYSGHADDTGLRIGTSHVPYNEFRARVESIPASVRITVLDACASGTITRRKGGERRRPFLIDESSDTKGYVFLTSSSENEAAQESDAIGASFFTHYLVSGLRGGADVSGDGRVSLTEAYQFAFKETLARTAQTMAGAQHPAYDMNLAGTGDVVMTDVRLTSAGLVLEKPFYGRFFVRDRDEHLVAELYKLRGQRIVLGLETGSYTIHLDREGELLVARIHLGLEDLLVLEPSHFETEERTPTVARGESGEWPPRPGFMGPLVGRSRLQLILGKNQKGAGEESITGGTVSARAKTDNFYFGIGYWRWIREDLSLGVTLLLTDGDAEANVGAEVVNRATGLISLRVGAQKYGPDRFLKTPVRPFLSLAAGVLIGAEETSEVAGAQVISEASTMGAFGVEFGGGVDFLLSHHLMLGSKAAYNLVTDFPEPLAGEVNNSGWELSVNVGWLFGRGFGG